jgi:tRNA dimethylallyltransferase
MQNTLLVLLGPTGVGKTNLSVDIATNVGCDIISCDSRQFYREMRIGTCTPTEEQLNKVKHHFIRFISIEDYYSSSLFERDVISLLPSLFENNQFALMCGGSGMYIDAVCDGFDNIPDTDPDIRDRLNRKYREEGIESLRVALRLLDPEHYSKVDLKNPKRILRALEICESAGRAYSSFINKEKTTRDFRIVKIGLRRQRDELYDLINRRVDELILSGLEEEARSLHHRKNLNALNTVGYRELFDYFENIISRDKAIELIKRNTRRYAKRQMTWWAKDKQIRWFHPDQGQEILEQIRNIN